MGIVSTLLYPELRALRSSDRARALRSARRNALDVVELVGIAAGLIVAALIARYASDHLSLALPAVALVTMGALALTVSPFLLRRTRRGLRRSRAAASPDHGANR